MSTREDFTHEDAGIRLKDIFNLIKVSAVRILIYSLVAVVLATVVILPFSLVQPKTQVTSTRVEFTYKGIDKGLSPTGKVFDKETLRSVSVLDRAITASGLGEKIGSVNDVYNAVSVEGVYTDEYARLLKAAENSTDEKTLEEFRNYVFYPVAFDVKLGGNNLSLTQDESVKLVDSIITEYRTYFRNEYGAHYIFSADVFDRESNMFDYIDYYDLFATELSKINSYLVELNQQNSSFRASNGKTFNDVILDQRVLNTQYTNFLAYILEVQVSKNPQMTLDSLNNQVTKLGYELDRLKLVQASLEAQISSYDPDKETFKDPITGEIMTQIKYPEYFSELQKLMTETNGSVALVTSQIAEYQARILKLTGSSVDDAKIATAENYLDILRTDSKTYINNAITTITEYAEGAYVQNSIRVIAPTVHMVSGVSIMPFAITYLAVIVGSVAVAMIVTYVKSAKLKETAAEAASV